MKYQTDIKEFLEEKYLQYNRPEFIVTDPVSIPHRFSGKENREISGFLTATIAWGQRPVILRNAVRLMESMGNDPFRFLLQTNESDWHSLLGFCHRTFSGIDLLYFLRALKEIYTEYDGLESVFTGAFTKTGNIKETLEDFHNLFFSFDPPRRTMKHVANVAAGASAKRLNMFLRWMVRNDGRGVDLGLWQDIPAASLLMPLDLHSGNVARALGLLQRRQNDWKAVEELTANLRRFDPADPVKYDYALFGLGVFEGFK